jgi:YD repeat-containing protein
MGSTQQVVNAADELCWTAATTGSCGAPPSGATTYTYDARGNRTQVTPPVGGATTLSYDQANRLTAYGSAATYAYNGDGLRMSKTISEATTQFLWDVAGSLPLLIKDGSTAYLYGPSGLPDKRLRGSLAASRSDRQHAAHNRHYRKQRSNLQFRCVRQPDWQYRGNYQSIRVRWSVSGCRIQSLLPGGPLLRPGHFAIY